MDNIFASITTKTAAGVVAGAVLIAAFGFSSVAKAAPLPGADVDARAVTALMSVTNLGSGSDTAVLKLVGTREHDDDAAADRTSADMSSSKKKTDPSVKPMPGTTKQSGQGHGSEGKSAAKGSSSANTNDELGQGIDRQDDRRQGKNIERKP